jgi:hypothetical protein
MWRQRKALRVQEYEDLQVSRRRPAPAQPVATASPPPGSPQQQGEDSPPPAAACAWRSGGRGAAAPRAPSELGRPPLPAPTQFEVKALKQQMGFATAAPPGAPDITRANLELLRLERDKMINERVRAAAAAAAAAGPSLAAAAAAAGPAAPLPGAGPG